MHALILFVFEFVIVLHISYHVVEHNFISIPLTWSIPALIVTDNNKSYLFHLTETIGGRNCPIGETTGPVRVAVHVCSFIAKHESNKPK